MVRRHLRADRLRRRRRRRRQGERRPARRHDDAQRWAPAAGGRPGHRQDPARPGAGRGGAHDELAHPVHPGPAALRRHRRVDPRPADPGVRVPPRPGLRLRRPRRRDQPGLAQDAVRAAGGHGGRAGDLRRRHVRRRAPLPRHRHPEPGGAGRHLPAAGGPARPFPHEDLGRLPGPQRHREHPRRRRHPGPGRRRRPRHHRPGRRRHDRARRHRPRRLRDPRLRLPDRRRDAARGERHRRRQRPRRPRAGPGRQDMGGRARAQLRRPGRHQGPRRAGARPPPGARRRGGVRGGHGGRCRPRRPGRDRPAHPPRRRPVSRERADPHHPRHRPVRPAGRDERAAHPRRPHARTAPRRRARAARGQSRRLGGPRARCARPRRRAQAGLARARRPRRRARHHLPHRARLHPGAPPLRGDARAERPARRRRRAGDGRCHRSQPCAAVRAARPGRAAGGTHPGRLPPARPARRRRPRGDLRHPHLAALRHPGRAGAHGARRPAGAHAPRGGVGRAAGALRTPPDCAAELVGGRVHPRPRGPAHPRHHQRRPVLPRAAGVRAGRRPPPRPLAHLRPHRHPHGPPVRGDPPLPPRRRDVPQRPRLRRGGGVRGGRLHPRLAGAGGDARGQGPHHADHPRDAARRHPRAVPRQPHPPGARRRTERGGEHGPPGEPGRRARLPGGARLRLHRDPGRPARRRGRAADRRPGLRRPGRHRRPDRGAQRRRRHRADHRRARRAAPRLPQGGAPVSSYLRLLRSRVLDVLVPAGLVLLALLPLVPVYASGRLAAAAVGGVLLGTLVATLGAWRRWTTLTVLAALLVAGVLGSSLGAPGTALAGLVPTPQTVGAVGSGAVTSWKQVLTLAPPLGAVDNLLTAPYLLGLLAALVAVTVSLRTRRPAWALVPPAVVLAVAILLGTAAETTALPLALVGGLGGLVWAAWRTGRLQRRPLAVLVLLAVAAAGGTGTGLLARGEEPRLVLREVVEPPLDPHDYPSPLAGFRAYLKDHREETVLTVRGLPAGTPLRLATMDVYDGTVWAVAGGAHHRAASSGTFTRIGERVEATVPDDAVTVEVGVGAYTGVWVPTVGRTYDIEFAGPDAAETERHLYVNRASGTGLLTTGLREGDRYTLLATPTVEPPVSALEGAPLARVDQPELSGVPDTVVAAASAMVASAQTPLARIQAIVSSLQDGYFSHGLEGDAPSLAGHGAARLAAMVGQEAMIGDAEQYAALAGLLGRAVGLPTRVVMGFAPEANTGPGPVEDRKS